MQIKLMKQTKATRNCQADTAIKAAKKKVAAARKKDAPNQPPQMQKIRPDAVLFLYDVLM